MTRVFQLAIAATLTIFLILFVLFSNKFSDETIIHENVKVLEKLDDALLVESLSARTTFTRAIFSLEESIYMKDGAYNKSLGRIKPGCILAIGFTHDLAESYPVQIQVNEIEVLFCAT